MHFLHYFLNLNLKYSVWKAHEYHERLELTGRCKLLVYVDNFGLLIQNIKGTQKSRESLRKASNEMKYMPISRHQNAGPKHDS
jgi:hypothetical protein